MERCGYYIQIISHPGVLIVAVAFLTKFSCFYYVYIFEKGEMESKK
jgi:hypothetical protein